MALPETLPFTLGWITPTTATITATSDTATVTAPDTIAPTSATLTATLGTPTVTAAVTISPTTTAIAATPGTPDVTAPDSIAPTGVTIIATEGTPAVTAPDTIAPSSATITGTPGTPAVSEATPVPAGDLPWTLPIRLGGINSIIAAPDAIVATTGTPTVAGAASQSPLPWTLPIVLGGNQNLFPTAARIATTTATAVISGTGFPYQFPFTFPADVVNVFPTSAIITALLGTPSVAGGAPAITPAGVAIYTQTDTPTVTGPSRRTITPGSVTIAATPGISAVHTVAAATTVFLCDGTQNLLQWATGALAPLGDNPLISTVLPALINTETAVLHAVNWPDTSLPMLTSMNIGKNNLAAAIANCGGNFVLVGYSQGAAICSMVLKEMQSGGLINYASQCIGAVMFGNISRQAGAIAPAQADPGGRGAWSANLLTTTPTWWWEFANTADVATTLPNSPFGQLVASILSTFLFGYTTSGGFVAWMLNNLRNGIQAEASALGELVTFIASVSGLIPVPRGMPSFVPHGDYHDSPPPGSTQTDSHGTLLTSAQLAANYINGLTRGTPRTWRTVTPDGTTLTLTPGAPDVTDLISAPSAAITATAGTAVVTAPVTVSPSGATIVAALGTPDQTPSILPWVLPVVFA